MVLQVLADARPVGDDLDPECAELRRPTDPGKLQELRRIDRPAAQDNLAPRAGPELAPVAPVMDTGGAASLEGDARRQRMGEHPEVAALHGGLEVGVGGGCAYAVPDRHVEGPESFLPLAVE